jgi:hypothetical protein
MDQELLGSHPHGSHDLPRLKSEGNHFLGVFLLQLQNHLILPKSYRMLGQGVNLLRLDDHSTISTVHCG